MEVGVHLARSKFLSLFLSWPIPIYRRQKKKKKTIENMRKCFLAYIIDVTDIALFSFKQKEVIDRKLRPRDSAGQLVEDSTEGKNKIFVLVFSTFY